MLPNVVVVWLIKTPSWSRDMKLDLPTAESPAKMILNVRSAGPVGSQSSSARKLTSLFSLMMGWKWLNIWDGQGEGAARCNSFRKEADGCGDLKLRLKEPDLSSMCSFCSFSKSELWPLSKFRRWNGICSVIHFQLSFTSSYRDFVVHWKWQTMARHGILTGRRPGKKKSFQCKSLNWLLIFEIIWWSFHYQQAIVVVYRNLRELLKNRWYPGVGD